jgi:hypothetical protein
MSLKRQNVKRKAPLLRLFVGERSIISNFIWEDIDRIEMELEK